MMRPTIGLHPGFDELSAHADLADTDAARTRVARHVARCAACRRTVAEIRALGTAARASALPGAPAGLWQRIEHGLDETTKPDHDGGIPIERAVLMAATRETDAPAPTARAKRSGSKMVRRTALALALLAVASAAVVALDARDQLAAATPRRLTTDRDHARPGVPITFHYRPIDALADQRSLTVWMLLPNEGVHRYDHDLLRAGTLHRVSALDYTGSVAMPDSTPLAMFIVGDSTGDVIDRTELRAGRLPIVVLAADSGGQPRLDAFVLALGAGRGSPDEATMTRWAKRMRELYPSAPETWILSAVHAPRSVIGDIVKLFESRERQYDGWHDRLEHRADLSEDTEVMMATLGWELMDTARAEFWTNRLLKDHPTSASLPGLWIQPYRDVPDDSAAIVLRAFEPIYTAAPSTRYDALSRALALADRSGDSALVHRWHRRVDPGNVSWLLSTALGDLASDSAARADIHRRLLEALAATDSAMHGGPTVAGRSRYFAWAQRGRLRTRLAALQLIGGDARGAKSALDTIVREMELYPTCPARETMRWRAEASRTLGLMDSARADLAYAVETGDWRSQVVRDSMPALLGNSWSKASWDSAVVAADAFKQKCWADSRDARRRAGG
jgi:hypothetical protein